MVSQIQLGNLYTQNGKQVLNGGSSGLDTKALIDGLAEAKRLPATKLEASIELNTKKSQAYSDMKETLSRFKDAANFLRNPPGISTNTENVFNYRKATLTSNSVVAGETYLTADVQPGTPPQTFTINQITSLAKAKKQETTTALNLTSVNDSAVDAIPAGGSGRFAAGIVTVRGQAISLNVGDSLATVANKFNAVKDSTGISASIVQTSPGLYKMIFTANKTGLTNDFDLSSAADVTDPSGVFAQVGFGNLQSAADAVFQLDNVTITRDSNTISDVIPNTTLNLKQVTPGGTDVKLDVEADKDLMKTAIVNFIDSYNEFRIFVAKQTETNDDGTLKDTALLSTSPTMRSLLTRLGNEISKAVAGLGATDPARLSDIGITFKDFPGNADTPATRNIMSVDEGKLAAAISADPDKIRKIFAFDMTSDSSDLTVFRRTNDLGVNDFSLNIDQVGNTYTASYTDGGVPVTVNLDAQALAGGGGKLLTGQAGTKLAGLVLIYSNTTNATITAHASQGIGDRIFNVLDQALQDTTGSVSVEIDALKKSNDRMKTEIDRIDQIVAKFREQMLEKFSILESSIARINNILSSLDANAQARANN